MADEPPQQPQTPPPGWESQTTEFSAYSPQWNDGTWGDPATPYVAPGSDSTPAPAPQQYGQPAPPYPGQQYPTQPYPGQPYPGQPYAGPPYPPQQQPPWPVQGYAPPPPPRRRAWVWGLAALVVVAALVVAGVLVFGDDSSSSHHAARTTTPTAGGTTPASRAPSSDTSGGGSGRSISLPTTVGSYTKFTALNTSSLLQLLGGRLGKYGTSSSASVEHAKVAAYTKGASDSPGLIFIAIALQDVPTLQAQVRSQGVGAALAQFVNGAAASSSGGTSQEFTPGPLGGAMRCATGAISSQSVVDCGWGDASYFALTIVVDPGSTAAGADVTRTFRNAVEH